MLQVVFKIDTLRNVEMRAIRKESGISDKKYTWTILFLKIQLSFILNHQV